MAINLWLKTEFPIGHHCKLYVRIFCSPRKRQNLLKILQGVQEQFVLSQISNKKIKFESIYFTFTAMWKDLNFQCMFFNYAIKICVPHVPYNYSNFYSVIFYPRFRWVCLPTGVLGIAFSNNKLGNLFFSKFTLQNKGDDRRKDLSCAHHWHCLRFWEINTQIFTSHFTVLTPRVFEIVKKYWW